MLQVFCLKRRIPLIITVVNTLYKDLAAYAKQDWTTKQAALNFGWVLPVFVQLRAENQLIFVEKLYFRAINSGYRIENRAILVIKYVYTLTVGRQGKE